MLYRNVVKRRNTPALVVCIMSGVDKGQIANRIRELIQQTLATRSWRITQLAEAMGLDNPHQLYRLHGGESQSVPFDIAIALYRINQLSMDREFGILPEELPDIDTGSFRRAAKVIYLLGQLGDELSQLRESDTEGTIPIADTDNVGDTEDVKAPERRGR